MTNYKKNIALFACYVLGVILYTTISYKLGINSDSASSILIAKDASEGNFLLNGWILSTQAYYFTDIFWMSLLFKIFGYHVILSNFFVGLTYAAMVAVSIKLLNKKTLLGVSVIFGVVILPSHFQAISSLVVNIHITTYLCALFCMFLVIKFTENSKKSLLLPVFFLSVLTLYSDSIYIYVFILPLFLSAIVSRLNGLTTTGHLVTIATLSITIMIAGSIFGFIMAKAYHFQLPNIALIANPKFQSEDLIGNNFYLFFNGLFDYFGGKFFGLEIKSKIGAVNFFNFLASMAFLTLVLTCAIKSLKLGFAEIFISASATIITFAYLVSDLATDIMTPRYFYFSLVAGSILIGRVLCVREGLKYSLIILFVVSGIFKAIPLRGELEDPSNKNLHAFLVASGLKNGYAGFWSASSITILGDVNIAPVLFDGNVHSMRWLSNESWYKNGRDFIIFDNAIDYATGISQFGQPTKTLEYKEKKIAIYDNKIFLKN